VGIFLSAAFWLTGALMNAASEKIYVFVFAIFETLYILINICKGLYKVSAAYPAGGLITEVSKTFMLALSLCCFFFGTMPESGGISFLRIFIYLETGYIFYILSAVVSRRLLKKDSLYTPRALIVGSADSAERLKDDIGSSNLEMHVVGFICPEESQTPGCAFLGSLGDLEGLLHKYAIDEVFFINRDNKNSLFKKYFEICALMGVSVSNVVSAPAREGLYSYSGALGGHTVIKYHRICLNPAKRLLKRTLDIIVSLVGIVITAPIMLITAAAIKLDSKGPVLFMQSRIGMNGRVFKIYKFRSMRADAETLKKKLMEQNNVKGGFMFKVSDDPRITKVGKFIRKYSIDELPQFFNILFGTMSLVGTRPPTMDEVGKYQAHHWRRMSVKPGLTGIWQTSGRNKITDFEEVVKMDTYYIDHWSVWLDIKIIFKTFGKLFNPSDVV
jgi:exopolysaccharide biosynthesis polyprenyl glycosylphosphotransferase